MSKRTLVGLAISVLMLPVSLAAQDPYGDHEVTTGNPFTVPEAMHDCGTEPNNVLLNCGFETGDFTDWVATDIASPFIALQVSPGGMDPGFGNFISAPTEGTQAAVHGFDGGGPGVIEIAQDVTLEGGTVLEFDYRGAWDLATFGATQDRTFEVQVQPAGGGAPMQTDLILTAPVGDVTTDTGPLTGTVDLSAFGGQTVRVAFVWNIPENFSGPGFFQLDNVQAVGTANPLEIPTADTRGLALLMVLLMAAAIWFLRARRA